MSKPHWMAPGSPGQAGDDSWGIEAYGQTIIPIRKNPARDGGVFSCAHRRLETLAIARGTC
jgi:hypothetical protein